MLQTLPDQHHCYFMTETTGLEGVLISSISFTLASQLPQVIATLRQQLMFNTLVGSCVRLCSKPGKCIPRCHQLIIFNLSSTVVSSFKFISLIVISESGSIIFEVSALSHHNLSVSFQHPLDDSLVTLEFDIRDVMLPQCRVHALYSTTPDMIPTLEEHACAVVRRSLSIPVTVRAVIRRWQSMKIKTDIPKPDSLIPAPNTSTNSSINPLMPVAAPSCGIESQQTQPNSFKPCMNYNAPAQAAPIDFISYMSNPIFASLSQNFQSQTNSKNGQSPATSHGNLPGSSVLQGLLDQNNPAKRRKRNKTSTEIQKSPGRQKSPIRQEEPPGSAAAVPAATPAWMSELGLEQDCRWNIDITPVSNSQSAEELKRKFPVKRSVSLDSNVEADDRLPSLSITPVNSNASTSTTVNSLLASIRPGIEIIPLPNPSNPPAIPNSITVTPILPNSTDLKRIKKRADDPLEKKKLKRFDIKHSVNKLQQQGGKPSVSAMKSVSTLPKPKKLGKPSLDITKKMDQKLEKDKSLVIYQPPKTQAATQAVAAALAAANKTQQLPKKSSLDSVINKLKSAAAADCDSTVKKSEQMSTKDLLKASSSITDIIQKTASKVNEYSVKSSSGLVPGGGLKLTINKAIAASKFGMDMKKKPMLKRTLGQKPKPLTPISKDDQRRTLVKKEEMNKITDTRKLYMPTLEPGVLFKDSPKFDLKNFQIPKKSKPVEKIEPPSHPLPPPPSTIASVAAVLEKTNPELVVETVNPPPPVLAGVAPLPPQSTPPKQPPPLLPPALLPVTALLPPPMPPVTVPTPQAVPPPVVTSAPVLSATPATTPSLPVVPDLPATTTPKADVAMPVEPTPVEPVTLAPPQPVIPQPIPAPLVAPPPKETIISPESPEPMDTAETIVTPQNIPTTPPTTAEEAPPEKAPEPENAAPPRSTTPAPPPRSVTPAPPRSTTPAPVVPPAPVQTPVTQSQPATQPPPPPPVPAAEKTAPVEEKQAGSQLPPPQSVSEPDSSPVVSMHCIVKSPAPNSPMLLRSPALIVQSPHTPFTIDDDLMDEALIGGGPTNSDKTAS